MLSERVDEVNPGDVRLAGRIVRVGFLIFAGIILLLLGAKVWLLILFDPPFSAAGAVQLRQLESGLLILLVVLFLCFVVNVVFFCIWQYRATKAVELRADIDNPSISAGWQVGWWFIPVANLFMPVKALGEVYRASREGSSGDWKSRPLPGSILGWWLLWLGSTILDRVADRNLAKAENLRAVADAIWLGIGANILTLISLGLIARIVRDICEFQERWEQGLSDGVEAPASA